MEESPSRNCSASVLCGRTSLLLIMTGYAIFGAFVFKTLEGGDVEHDASLVVQKSREDCLKELWLITERLNVLYERNWTKLVTEQLKKFENAVIENKSEGHKLSNVTRWTYGNAFVYSLTILTTVGYGTVSPKTAMGKMVTVIYAIFGVPLMLILLSELGSFFACGAAKGYTLVCKRDQDKHPVVGYHKAPSSPSGRKYFKNNEDSASIQLAPCNNHVATKTKNYQEFHQEVQKRALVATVRSTRVSRHPGPVRQILADPSLCPAHCHGPPIKKTFFGGSVIISDVDEDPDEEGNGIHNTPTRVPLIWKESSRERTPSVPLAMVFGIFGAYVCVGAALLVSTGWGFVDAAHFCFLALTTISVEDRLPHSATLEGQLQLAACCAYLFFGLVLVAMCFSLVQEEVAQKMRYFASNVGYPK